MPGSEPHREPRRRTGGGSGRMMLGATVVLAAGGAAVLALTDDARWLRLGIVAALWAALAGAFAAARYRREAAGGHDHGDDQLRIYQLELEREVAARRQHELQVEADTRRRLEAEVRTEVSGELGGLRSELHALRQNLEALLGGEVLVERVALRAESTRLRSLSDQSRAARTADRALLAGGSDTGSWPAGAVRPQPPKPVPAEPAPVRPAASRPAPVYPVQHPYAEPAWPERSGPQRMEPSWGRGSRSQPAERPGLAERTEVMSRYRPSPSPSAEPAPAPAAIDPLTTPDWDRFEQWTASEPPAWPASAARGDRAGARRRADDGAGYHGAGHRGPDYHRADDKAAGTHTADDKAGTQSAGHTAGTQSAGHTAGTQSADDEVVGTQVVGTQAAGAHTAGERNATSHSGGRRRAQDGGAHTTSRSVEDLLAAHHDGPQPRRRHGRADA